MKAEADEVPDQINNGLRAPGTAEWLRTLTPVHSDVAVPQMLDLYGYKDLALLMKITAHWSFIIGSDMSRKIKPKKVAGHTLILHATESTYFNSIRYKKWDILSYIRVTIQDDTIRDISFTVSDTI